MATFWTTMCPFRVKQILFYSKRAHSGPKRCHELQLVQTIDDIHIPKNAYQGRWVYHRYEIDIDSKPRAREALNDIQFVAVVVAFCVVWFSFLSFFLLPRSSGTRQTPLPLFFLPALHPSSNYLFVEKIDSKSIIICFYCLVCGRSIQRMNPLRGGTR
jgi:hypothetical protein